MTLRSIVENDDYVKGVRIWCYSGPHFPALGLREIQENAVQNNSKYGHFPHSVCRYYKEINKGN